MILRINFSFLFIFLTSLSVLGQINDDFSDGDFTANPVWSGDGSEFEVDGGFTLHVNAPAATAESYISTPNTNIDLTTWEFMVSLGFNPSSSNRALIYLVSDAADLEGSLNGYFVMVGNSDDEISLYRQDGTSTTKILDGTDDIVNLSSVDVWIRVTRDNDGQWELFYDLSGTDTYNSEGTVTDNTYTTTSHFGFVCDYTSTRSTLFNFDDVSVIASTQVDSVIVTSSTGATVIFNQEVEQTTAENTGNYTVDNSITLASATRDGTNLNEVDLVFNESLTSLTYLLSTSGIQDEFSNTAQTTASTFDFDYLVMELDTAITLSDSTIQVTYNQDVDETTGTNTANYTIDNSIGNPTSATIVENDSNKVVLEIGSVFMDAITYNLAIANVQNKNQNSTVSDNQDFEYIEPLLIDTVIVNSNNELLVLFSKSLDQTTAETASNYTIDNSIGNPSTATLSNSDSVILTLSSNLVENTYEVSISDVEDSDNNSIEASSTFSFDYLPLELNSLSVNSDKEIELVFNQSIDQTTAETLSNYSINFDIGNPDSLDFTVGDSNILLYFSGLVNNEYEITIENISNELENAELATTTAEFTNSVATSFKDIIISEIFPDPNPSVALPTEEFIEIYNRTESHISIEDFTLSGGTIDSAVIAPDSYIILTSSSVSGDYTVYGDVVEVSSMPGLTNSGRLLSLQDQLGNDIDSINYSDDWYQDTDKSDGGYTLELINQDLACSDQNNWIASNNADGGTPGSANSVLDNTPDTTSPVIEGVSALDTDQLQITFSEPMDEASLSSATYTISGFTISVNTVVESGFGGVIVDLDTDLISETTYSLTISGATDCSGNTIDGSAFEFYYDITAPQIQKVVINSLDQLTAVFNEPLNESIAETESNYTVDNGIGNPSSAILDNDDNTRVFLTFSTDLNIGTTYDLSIDNLEDTLSNAITSTQNINFEYSQQIDSVIVIANTLVDIYFDEAIDSSAATVVSNYDIEDVGNPSQAIPDESVDSLVHLVLSTNLNDNSTLTLTIENLLDADSNDLVTPEFEFVYDTRSPTPQSITATDSVTLTVSFSEALDQTSSETLENYQLDNDAFPDSASLQSNSTDVILIFSDEFEEEVEQTLSISDIKDIYGNEMSSTRNLDFTFDELAPRIDTIQQFAEDSVMIQFVEYVDRTSAEEVTNYTFDGSVNPSQASRYSIDSTIVFLKFDSDLTESAALDIELDNVADINGNAISVPISTTLNTLNPTIAEITPVSLTEVKVTFSKTMDATEVATASNYVLNSTTNPSSISTSDNQQVHLTFSDELIDGADYSLELSNITDDATNSLSQTAFEFTFNDYLESLSILNEYTIQLVWEKDMAVPELNDFTLTNSGDNPIAISRDSEDLNILQLLFSDSLQENTADTLSWSGIVDNNELIIPDGFATIFLDTDVPAIDSVASTYFNELTITFSESVESTSALASNHYNLLTIGNPSSVESITSTQYLLIFEDSLTDATDYSLVVDRVSDDSGNSIEDTITLTFESPYIPVSGDLIITEIMADPSPVVGLPEVEFIELFNNSSEDINLRQITLSDDSEEINLPDSILSASSYTIIVASSDSDEFSEISVVAVDDFPSLSNSEDSLTLSLNETTLDVIEYTSDWYQDEDKDSGGYSLERINITATCEDEENWSASLDPSGGTPGLENSIFNNNPDTENPTITSLTIASVNELKILFSESVDTASIDISDVTISLGISSLDKYYDSLIVNLSEDIDSSLLYSITVEAILDCAGNSLETFNSEFALGKEPEEGDLLITEIMADPTPAVGLPEVEFIEIYNNSTSIINLNSVNLSDATSSTSLTEYLLESGEYLILTTESGASSYDTLNVLGVSSFPSLGNSEDSIVISFEGTIINSIEYDNSWYQDSDKDDGGYTLERINFTAICSEAENWSASEDSSGGTPGKENSIFNNNPDSINPEITALSITGSNELTIQFSESIDTSSIDNSDITVSLDISNFDKYYDSLIVAFSENIDSSLLYDITIESILDCAGNSLETFNSEFAIGKTPTEGDLLITEIMSDPTPAVGLPEVEFIEIYNNSSSIINLADLELSDATSSTSLTDYLLESGEYLIITTTSGASSYDTLNVLGLSGFPSLGNSEDSLVISLDGEIINSLEYDISWYRDTEKDNGGYTLERINITPTCTEELNWIASQNVNGGTPGAENSVFNNNPDSTSPTITEIQASTNELIIYFSESVDTSSIQESDIDITLAISGLIKYFDSLIIQLSESIVDSELYTIEIDGISDCAGNELVAFQGEFGIGKTPELGDLIITEVMADPSPAVGLPEVEYVEIYNNSSDLLNLSEVSFGDASTIRDLPNYLVEPNEYLLLLASNFTDEFDTVNTLGIEGFPSLTNSSDSIGLIVNTTVLDHISYDLSWYQDSDKDNGGYSLERITFNNNCEPSSNWAASNSSFGGTPGFVNSILNQNPDDIVPSVVGISVIGQDTLILAFDEAMDTTSFSDGDIVLDPVIAIGSTNWNTFSEVTVILSESIEASTLYNIEVSNINDCAGNAMNTFSSTIGIGRSPEAEEIIITEIFPDPSPVVGLPEAEYIEILNNTDDLLILEGLVLEDLTGNTELPAVFIAPSQYLVLTSSSNLSGFDAIDNVIGVSGFPSLGNESDLVKISLNDVTIDSLIYERDWYRDTDKDDGGYSLELINPDAICSGPNNWTASQNELGGTPGSQNSVFNTDPDTESPTVSSFSFDANQISIDFDEIMDIPSLNAGSYTFDPSLTVSNLEASLQSVTITFNEELPIGTLYELTISNVTDCSGNSIATTTLEFGLGVAPTFNDVLITEIMADPEPPNDLPNAEYLEIYNASNNLIDLSTIEISDLTETTLIEGGILKPGEYAILTPNSSASDFTSVNKVFGISSWPSLGNSSDQITLSYNSEEIFIVAYDEAWYDDSSIEGGVSLEMIDVTNPCGEDDNWTASSSSAGGTPGALNASTASNPDLTGPSITGAFAIDDITLQVNFDENIEFLASEIQISIDPTIIVIGINHLSKESLILDLGVEIQPEVIYTLSVNNVSDCNGNNIVNNSTTFVLPESSDSLDIVVNEILFNPTSTGVDFVEIYNRSSKNINLKNWSLGNLDFYEDGDKDIISSTNLIIGPDSYLVFTESKEVVINEYPEAVVDNIIEINDLPTLANDEGTVILIDSTNQIIDLVDYFEDYHYNLLDDEDGVSLERISSEASSLNGDNWRSASSTVGFATPGYVNSQQFNSDEIEKVIQIEPEVFTPADPNSGLPSFTTINYEFENAGNFANVRIYNTNGQLIRTIANGELLSTTGFFRWDGTNNNGKVAEVGYYVVHFELFSSDGSKKSFQKTVVVGRQF